MSYCANCGTIKNETTGVCPKCSVKKKWIWQRLGFIGSGVFIVIGLLLLAFSQDLANQITCGGPVCSDPVMVNATQTFIDIISQGIKTLVVYVIVACAGITLTTFGVIGLVTSIIAARRKRQNAFYVDGSK